MSGEYCHSFKFGVESALIHYKALQEKKPIWDVLGLDKPKEIPTSFSVPIMEEDQLKEYLEKLSRFPYIKIKVNNF